MGGELDASRAELAKLKRDLEAAGARQATTEAELEQQRAELTRIRDEADRLARQRAAFQDETLRLLTVLRAADLRMYAAKGAGADQARAGPEGGVLPVTPPAADQTNFVAALPALFALTIALALHHRRDLSSASMKNLPAIRCNGTIAGR